MSRRIEIPSDWRSTAADYLSQRIKAAEPGKTPDSISLSQVDAFLLYALAEIASLRGANLWDMIEFTDRAPAD